MFVMSEVQAFTEVYREQRTQQKMEDTKRLRLIQQDKTNQVQDKITIAAGIRGNTSVAVSVEMRNMV